MIVWNEPLMIDENLIGNSVVRATEEDVIKFWKASHSDKEWSDEEALNSFIAVYWAWKEEGK